MPKLKGPSKAHVSLRLPIETLDACRAEAEEDGVPMSEVLRSLWDLRVRMHHLPDHQRVAIIDTSKGNQVVEFIGLKKLRGKAIK